MNSNRAAPAQTAGGLMPTSTASAPARPTEPQLPGDQDPKTSSSPPSCPVLPPGVPPEMLGIWYQAMAAQLGLPPFPGHSGGT